MRMNVWQKIKKVRLQNKILIGIVCIVIVYILLFLHSIHFKVQYYFFDFSLDTHDVINFDDYKNDLEVYVNEVDQFVQSTPDFFEKFDGYCLPTQGNLHFTRKSGLILDEDDVDYVSLEPEKWKCVVRGIGIFPAGDGYGEAYLDSEYPDYIFFPAETQKRFFVYTRGERPNVLIDSYWEGCEFVRVIKLARGWYDIRLIG